MERMLSHYRLEEEIGRGGMGVVYAAVDTKLGRRVAIKILPPEAVADPERRRRFLVEARAASALNHPNIAHIYELVDLPPEGGSHRDGGTNALVMELVDGTPLDRVIAAGALPIATALDYATQIASALEAAHAAGIIHRDIKPANVMIARDGRARVLDFGLAKLVEGEGENGATVTSAATRLGVILGTAAYMSPEQAQGRPLDGRSDLFSLGAVLYEMLAGRRAFTGDTQLAAISSILHETPPPLANAPRGVDAIVQRALQKSPDARYPDAGAMHADLAAAVRRLTAPRDAVWRRPAILVPAGLALIAVSAIGTWQTVQARGARWAREDALPCGSRGCGSR
jgi:serine/threonine protein kinase